MANLDLKIAGTQRGFQIAHRGNNFEGLRSFSNYKPWESTLTGFSDQLS